MNPEAISGTAAGVPFVLLPPSGGRRPAPVVVAWHLLDAPRTEAAFAAALPLTGLDAWRIYLGLPMAGSRSLPGGYEELFRLASEDAVLNVYGPLTQQALDEFQPALAELRSRFPLGEGPIGLLGGSLGAAVAGLVLAEKPLEVAAAVLVSPLLQLREAIDAISRHFGVEYTWSEASDRVAARLDFAARADEIAARGEPAVLIVVGEEDRDFARPAAGVHQALKARYTDPSRVDMVTIAGMGHALAEEPGIEPAPQTPHAAQIDRLAVDWFMRYLPA